ncbi:hypothetical protein [Comamonas antarctica]|jgi:tripartite-type tricarboxylate transporter receptor subunit TctC|uniref:Uncharacterized protein n=1 Tax=Comamonas antarctica TaxID=2743470 RepID=A0A6N1WZ86_9BURK|nr:hypothetical protein [Comamonas antarctica]QKV51393.1 hypothetical protein HUK68_13505 [Comamonas antarctica]
MGHVWISKHLSPPHLLAASAGLGASWAAEGSWPNNPIILVVPYPAGGTMDTAKLHALEHAGKYFQVKGPLNAMRSPQGEPC